MIEPTRCRPLTQNSCTDSLLLSLPLAGSVLDEGQRSVAKLYEASDPHRVTISSACCVRRRAAWAAD